MHYDILYLIQLGVFMNTKKQTFLLIAILFIWIAGCSGNNSDNPDNSDVTENPDSTDDTNPTVPTHIEIPGITTISNNLYNSTLRPIHQGVYDPISNKSFFTFMRENSNPYVVACDHNNGDFWGTPQRVLSQTSASKYNYPSIAILPDRRLVLTYASPFDDGVGFAISNNPADNTSWTTSMAFEGHTEYPKIIVDRKGYIYLFFTHMAWGAPAHQRWLYYISSTDNGSTWSDPQLALQRELDEPYGMCEEYVSYYKREPYRVGKPEKWYFSFTAAGGFQWEGTHSGTDNSTNLTDNNAEWGNGGNMDYRYLYNKTKGTHSGIDSADSTTIIPENIMDWDNGDSYGIAYHNINHSHVYVAAFRPDTGHWYDPAGNDLGETVTRIEMDTDEMRPYLSPEPPAGKNIGYIQPMAVNSSGQPVISVENGFIQWNGTSWQPINGSQIPSGDLRYFYYSSPYYYTIMNRVNASRSTDLINWNQIISISPSDSHQYSLYAVAVNEGHANAIINAHEYNNALDGNAWALGYGSSQIPEALLLRSETPLVAPNSTLVVKAIVCDKVNDARSRVHLADNQIFLNVLSGNAVIADSSVNAVNGVAEFSVITTEITGEAVLEATSDGLDAYRISIYIE